MIKTVTPVLAPQKSSKYDQDTVAAVATIMGMPPETVEYDAMMDRWRIHSGDKWLHFTDEMLRRTMETPAFAKRVFEQVLPKTSTAPTTPLLQNQEAPQAPEQDASKPSHDPEQAKEKLNEW